MSDEQEKKVSYSVGCEVIPLDEEGNDEAWVVSYGTYFEVWLCLSNGAKGDDVANCTCRLVITADERPVEVIDNIKSHYDTYAAELRGSKSEPSAEAK